MSLKTKKWTSKMGEKIYKPWVLMVRVRYIPASDSCSIVLLWSPNLSLKSAESELFPYQRKAVKNKSYWNVSTSIRSYLPLDCLNVNQVLLTYVYKLHWPTKKLYTWSCHFFV